MLKKYLYKFAIIVFALSLTLTFTGCSFTKIENSTSNYNTQSKNKNDNSNSISQSSKIESNSENNKVSASISTHTHIFNKEIVAEKYLKLAATDYTPGEYYYSCECGEKVTNYFTVAPLDRDYSDVDNYIDMLLKKGSANNPLWNTEHPTASWDYINGCMMTSFMNMYYNTNDEKYLNFVDSFLDYFVDDSGKIKGYSNKDYNVDNINEGRVLFDLVKELPNKTYYKEAINTIWVQLENHPRTTYTPSGSFFHKSSYANQIWLDGLYMAQPFNIRYLTNYTESGDYSDVMKQFKNVVDYMRDENTGLYYHGMDTSKTQSWANKSTGLSKSFWLRAMGWFIASLADCYYYMPKSDVENRNIFANYLKDALDSIWNYVETDVVDIRVNETNKTTKSTYMFYQVVDKGGENGNYTETSGSALIAYAMMKGANSGALTKEYFYRGKAVFNGICFSHLTNTESGDMQLNNICKMAGLGGKYSNGVSRDGTYNSYIKGCDIVANEGKGVAPFIMAYAELQQGNNLF